MPKLTQCTVESARAAGRDTVLWDDVLPGFRLRVGAHVLLCTLAYSVQWHMQRAWAPRLFADELSPGERPGPSPRPQDGRDVS